MSFKHTISILLNCREPFIRHADGRAAGGRLRSDDIAFFQNMSDTYIPFLRMCERLDSDRVPFRAGVVLSPALLCLLRDECLIERYMRYTERQIAFGEAEMARTKNPRNNALWRLAKRCRDSAAEKRALFAGPYKKNLIGMFKQFQKKGRVEILTTAATGCFIPFFAGYPESVRAQIETARDDYKDLFDEDPSGFWLPELGYAAVAENVLRAYNFLYTVIDSHAAILADPPAAGGGFYPLRADGGTILLTRDYYARKEIEGGQNVLARSGAYCDYFDDIGYKLDIKALSGFLDEDGRRCPTGYRYLSAGDKSRVYDAEAAERLAGEQARAFLDRRLAALSRARELAGGRPLCLCAWDASFLGRFWPEGFCFLEQLIRAAEDRAVLATPTEYLCREDSSGFQRVRPGFSSAGFNGYGESFLDKANDWAYRHIYRASARMTELAARFNESAGIRYDALNQAARETLLLQSADLVRLARRAENGEGADADWNDERLVAHLRNFTTLYESLGGDYLSTKILGALEKTDAIFPRIDYRIFRTVPAT